jgi:hypothetical protein
MKNFLFIYKPYKHKPSFARKVVESVNNNYCNYDFGFLYLSLKCIGNVDFVLGIENLESYLEKKYDSIFIDYKSIAHLGSDDLIFLRKKIKTSICLFVAFDHQVMLNENFDKCLNLLDVKLIYHTHLFKDYGMYKLSSNNLDKLRLIFHGLGFLDIKYDLNNYSFESFALQPKTNDIFFAGTIHPYSTCVRGPIIEYCINNFFDLKKIIINKPSLKKDEFINHILKSKINLALAGHLNAVSYRHLEILFLNSFLLSDITYQKFEISTYYSNLDAVTFKNEKELNDLIYFYLKSDKQREKITLELNKQFRKFYSPKIQSKKIYMEFI